jgi:Ca2+-dependent lipid-binding protein
LSDPAQARFLNTILQELWPFIDQGVSETVKEALAPILEQSKGVLLSELTLHRMSLGTIPPIVRRQTASPRVSPRLTRRG